MSLAVTTFEITLTGITADATVGDTLTGNGWSADVASIVTAGSVYAMDASTFTGTLATGTVTGGTMTGTVSLSTWTVVITQSNETAVNITGVADLGDFSLRFTTDVAHGFSAGDFGLLAGTTDYNGGWLISNVPSTTEFDVFYPEDPALTEITGVSDGLVFTTSQTGTFARGNSDPSGLIGLPGVTSQTIANRTIITLDANTTYNITGAFNLDPNDYQVDVLRQGNDSFHLNDGTNGFFMLGRRRRAANGVIHYSKGIGISGGWNSSGSSQVDMNAGWFVANGGEIRIGTRFNINGSLNLQRINKMTQTNTAGGESQYRIGGGSGPKEILGLTLDGQTAANKLFIRSTVDYGVFKFLRASFQTFLNDAQDITLEDFDVVDNIHTEDLLGISSTPANSTTVDVINPNSEPRGDWGGNDYDYFRTSRRVVIEPKDADGVAIPEYSIYATDFDDGNRRVGPRFAVDGTQDDTATNVYSAIDATATSQTYVVRWKVQIFDNDESPSEVTSYYYNGSGEIPFKVWGWGYAIATVTPELIGLGNNRPRTTLLPDFDWSGRDRSTVDALTELNTNADVYDWFLSFMGSNFATYNDLLVTISNSVLQFGDANVVASGTGGTAGVYTPGSPDVFDIVTSTFTGSVNTTGTFELQNGAELSGGTFTCDVITSDDDGTTHTDTSITKYVHSGAGSYSVTFDTTSPDEIEVTGGGTLTVNLVNGATVPPTITQTSGTITLSQTATVSAPNLIDGTRVQLYNVTKDVELDNALVSGGSGYSTTIDLQSADVDAGDEIRLRATYQSGVTAKRELETFQNASLAGNTFTNIQTDDDEYNTYGVDGSTITELTWDGVNLQFDINDADNTTVIQRIGAWYHYYITTATGIADVFGLVDWETINQIKVQTMQLDNVKAAPLLLTGGRIYREDGANVIALTSNPIHIEYDPVYNVTEEAIQAVVDAIKAKTDQLNFTGTDVQSVASNMRGTDGANTVAPDNASIAEILNDTSTTLPAQIADKASQASVDALETKTEADARQVALIAEHDATQAKVDTVDTVVDSIKDVTDQLIAILQASGVKVSDADKDALVDLFYEEPYADHQTAGTYGKLFDIIRKSNLSIDGTVTANPTTTSFDTDVDDPTGTHDNQTILFVSGTLSGYSAVIDTFTDGVDNTITLEDALPSAPSVNDEFVILPYVVHTVDEIQAGLETSANQTVINEGVKKASKLIPHSTDL